MTKYNVVLLGGSNSVMVNGLQKGLRQENINLVNLALGACSSIQNLYELKRDRNKEILKNADLIITESNINEIEQNWFHLEQLSPSLIFRTLNWLYRELFFLNKKVLVLILPYQKSNYKIINNFHRKNCLKYGFNLIDMQSYYEKNNLEAFGNRVDPGHQQLNIMSLLGKNIALNLHLFLMPKQNFGPKNPDFAIITLNEMENISEIEKNTIKNSMYCENTYRLNSNINLKFPKKYIGYSLIAIHTWNTGDNSQKAATIYSSIVVKNNHKTLVKEFPFLNSVQEVREINFLIDKNSYVCINSENLPCTEKAGIAQSYIKGSKRKEYCDIVAFLAVKSIYPLKKSFKNENIEIPKNYDFNHLIPPVELYKEIIDEYCAIMDPRKLAPLQKQITDLTNERNSLHNEKTQLQNELNSIPTKKANLEVLNLEQELINKKLQSKKLAKEIGVKLDVLMPKITLISANSAKARIHSHLSYKLGSALIANSKSILGYIRMPFILMAISIAHKEQNKNLKLAKDKLPPLESYADYQEALKEKECFTYKLGKAFIKAHKNWYGGGYIKFYFQDVPRLKREFKERGVK